VNVQKLTSVGSGDCMATSSSEFKLLTEKRRASYNVKLPKRNSKEFLNKSWSLYRERAHQGRAGGKVKRVLSRSRKPPN